MDNWAYSAVAIKKRRKAITTAESAQAFVDDEATFTAFMRSMQNSCRQLIGIEV